MYCSSLWRPYLLTDIELLERVQKKCILDDYTSCYKDFWGWNSYHMYIYDLADITFFVKSVKFPSNKFNIII